MGYCFGVRRYGDEAETTPTADPDLPAISIAQALAAGCWVLSKQDRGWELRWLEQRAAPRTPGDGPLDEAYRLALAMQRDDDASAVSIRVDDALEVVSATTSSGSAPTPTFELSLTAASEPVLTAWAARRFGVAEWAEITPGSRSGRPRPGTPV
jgi:hypothetical protein